MAASSRPPRAAAARSGSPSTPACSAQRAIDDGALARKALLVDASAATGKARTAAAEQRRRERCGRSRVADAHLAEPDEIGVLRHGVVARADRIEERRLVHGRGLREVGGRTVERERHDAKLSARRACKLVDGGAATSEVRDHLRGDLGREGGDALRRHAMISGKDKDLDAREAWRALTLPEPEPFDELLQPAEAPRRLGQDGFAARHARGGLRIALGQVETGRMQLCERTKTRHLRIDLPAPSEDGRSGGSLRDRAGGRA